MTDRELLEAAAKAAGLRVVSWLQDGYPFVADENGQHYGWSPLEFDSDALRLAVKLRLFPVVEDWSDGPWVFVPSNPEHAVPLTQDPYAATRRAIVRAAAALA